MFNRRCESQNGSIPEKVNLNGHTKKKKKSIFFHATTIAHEPCIIMLQNVQNEYEIDVENILPISN